MVEVVALHVGLPRVRGQQADEHLDGRAVARPVAAQQAEAFPAAHVQVYAVHGLDRAEVLGQAADSDRVVVQNRLPGVRRALDPEIVDTSTIFRARNLSRKPAPWASATM